MGIALTILIGIVVGLIGWLLLPMIHAMGVFATAILGIIVVVVICVIVASKIFEAWKGSGAWPL